ncbi:CoA-binding domain protein [Chloroherpeton thalassium ATCC 35110]|uniref:CoA-binding domain protein n=1 Tax=Chloroherpeton thalassium (strain ATCC 35110 / GB-78) TaxID=517418 RepID=B3QU27_CHLT3|nr:CoA-binding protein [Chloroherpeton thalassium]ACF12825.1 CoA-binding domain protein [Chloroherpeton thalassium ATCC 35110]
MKQLSTKMDYIEILKTYKTIAIVGVSDKPQRPSFTVTKYMIQAGYNIIPINPNLDEVLGLKCYPSLLELPEVVKQQVEVVNIFRKPQDVPPVVDEAIAIGAKAVWMQLGITNEAAAEKARNANLAVVENHCIAVDHQNHLLNA